MSAERYFHNYFAEGQHPHDAGAERSVALFPGSEDQSK
jgi:hypothetical protein